jgi:hypothetical protein
MSAFVAQFVRRTHAILLDADADDAFPLFTPAGEKLWVDGWDPVFLHPASGETQVGMVFATGRGEDLTFWSLLDYDPGRRHARYARVTPASRFGVVEVRLEAAGPRRTRAEVTYTYTALTESGNGFIAAFTEENYRQMIDAWRDLIHAYLAQAAP